MQQALVWLLALLTAASWAYWLVAWWFVRSFFRKRPSVEFAYAPPVSLLKPVRGLDYQAYENFVSFCCQDYPEYEILFGVADAADPVIPIIERVQRDFPQRQIRLVVARANTTNRKVGLLQQLAAQARYEILVMSDSDMRVTPDYLRRVVAPFADARVGLVTCAYRGAKPLTLTARLEALYMGTAFLPSVLVARKFLQMRFALGATMGVRRRDLERLGGLAVVADFLADDYQLGRRIAALGSRVVLSDYVITAVIGNTTFREQWTREVRWAHCSKVSRPLDYWGLLLTYSTPLALLTWIVSGFAPLGGLLLVFSIVWRWLVAWLVTGYTGDVVSREWLFWLPVRDGLSALVWVAGLLTRHVEWRGERFIVTRDGTLQPVADTRARGRRIPLSRLLKFVKRE